MEEQIQSLKESELTSVLAEGFAAVYHRQPQFPVSYLAHFMKNHQLAQAERKRISQKLSDNKKMLDQMVREAEEQKKVQAGAKLRSQLQAEQQAKFLTAIERSDYHEDILNEFCQHIAAKFNLTGAYIGELKHQKRKFDLNQDDSEEAHFDAEAPKLIYFEYTDQSHRDLMVGKTLGQESVLGRLLTQAGKDGEDNNAEQQEREEGAEKQAKPRDQVYFASVVDNKDLHFFKYPRLGAFLGFGVKINSYLSPKIFDENCLRVQNYRKELEQYEKLREEREAKFRQAYDEKANSGADEHELEVLEKEFEKDEAQFPRPEVKQLDSIRRQFVFGFDTLGQDRQIAKEEQDKIKAYIDHLRASWEKSELESHQGDIDRYLKLADKIEQPHNQTFLRLLADDDKQIAAHQEVDKHKDNQKLMELEMDTGRIDRLKEHLADEKYEPFIDQISKSKVIKYAEVVKYWLLFTGKKKEEITLPGTNLIDFRKARPLLSREEFIKHSSEYMPRGSKPEAFTPNYAKWERLERNMEKLDPATVAAYNIYLAFILRYLQLLAKVRRADRSKRVEAMREERRVRAERKRENIRRRRDRAAKLAALIAEAQEKEEPFDQEAWEAQHNELEENQMLEVGPEIVDEIDRDLETGEELFPEEQVNEEDEVVQEQPSVAEQ